MGLKQRLLDLIVQEGPLTIAQYMNLCLHDPEEGYYATRPQLGAEGDFITAPETSQMFGELVGLWCAQSWLEMGAPRECFLIECGGGSGALMADCWRASRALPEFRTIVQLILIEPSAPLRAAQRKALAAVGAHAQWIDKLEEAPPGPCLIVGNEFLDCLPVRQFIRTQSDWRERLVGVDAQRRALTYGLAPAPADVGLIPPALRDAAYGAVAEIRTTLPGLVGLLAGRLKAAPGRALFIDYGSPEPTGGDTFQAVRAHASADPLADPGAADLTAHVDFAILAELARAQGLVVAGPASQGSWLVELGIKTRAGALQAAKPQNAELIGRQLARLIEPDQMGGLFQAIALSSQGLPKAAGFA